MFCNSCFWEMCFANSHAVYVDGHQVLLHALCVECMMLLLMLLLLHFTIIDAACSPEQKQRQPPGGMVLRPFWHPI
jgi:hypothetical protein